MALIFRSGAAPDASAAAELIRTTFDACVAPDWSQQAAATFRSEIAPERLGSSLAAAAYQQLCVADDRLIGLVVLDEPHLLTLLFVDPAFHRRRVASTLLESALSFVETRHPQTRIVELNATPHSVPFYSARGFFPISPPFTRRGCRVTRMAYWMPYRTMKRDDG